MTPADPPAARRAQNARLAAAEKMPGRQGLRTPFVVSVAVAFVLNGMLLTGLATSAQAWRVAAHPSRQVTWVTAVAAAHAATQPESIERSSPARAPRVAAQVPEPAVASPVPNAAAPAATPEALPVAQEDGNDVRFYDYREVDHAAEPDSDWNLDAALLDGAGLKLLVFEVFIDASGTVVACTVLQPAVRVGVAVPSVRRIELSVQSSGQ